MRFDSMQSTMQTILRIVVPFNTAFYIFKEEYK